MDPDKTADEQQGSGDESTDERATTNQPHDLSLSVSTPFAEGDRIILTRDGRISCGRIISMICDGDAGPSGLVVWREPSDECNPIAFSGSQEILNSADFLTCVRADLHPIFRNHRYSLFGFPDTKYKSHEYFSRIVHTECGTFSFGTKLQSPSGGLFWCLGVLDTQSYRSPLKLLLYNIAKSSITELPMTKQCSRLSVIKPEPSDKDSYLEAIDAFTLATRGSIESEQDTSMVIPTSSNPKRRPNRTTSSVPESKRPHANVPAQSKSKKRTAKSQRGANRGAQIPPKRTIIDLESSDESVPPAPVRKKPPSAKTPRKTAKSSVVTYLGDEEIRPPEERTASGDVNGMNGRSDPLSLSLATSTSSQARKSPPRSDPIAEIFGTGIPPPAFGQSTAGLQMMQAILAMGAMQEQQSFERMEMRMEMRMESVHRRERDLERRIQLARFGFL
jgi:hypothetical protein